MAIPWSSTHLLRPPASVLDVLDDSLGIYGTQPTGNLELLARIEGFRVEHLAQCLLDRVAVRLRCLRGSSFIVPVHLLPIIQAATRERNIRSSRSYITANLTTDYEVWAQRIEDAIRGERLTAAQIRERVAAGHPEAKMIRYAVALMSYENRLVAAAPSPGWRSDGLTYALWSEWLPEVDVWTMSEEEGRRELARLYLDRHGPASVDDFSWWSGLTRSQARRSFEAVASGEASGLWWTRERDESGPPGVRLLPVWDTLFVTYRDRGRFLADEHYPYVYDRSGNATSVVLIDGFAAGVWDLGASDDHLEIRVAPFERFTKRHRADVESETQRIADLIGSQSMTIIECEGPIDLTQAKRNRFMSPLKDAELRSAGPGP